jgi:hypothetical protein
VVGVAVQRARGLRAEPFRYDFRFAALLFIGAVIVGIGVSILRESRALTRGDGDAWYRARTGSVMLLVVNAPLFYVQGFAIALGSFAAINLLVLVATRTSFGLR